MGRNIAVLERMTESLAEEAIKSVLKAETEAEEIVNKARLDADALIQAAKENAKLALENAKKHSEEAVLSARREGAKDGEKALSENELKIKEKCEARKSQMLSNKETVIGKILAALKE